ncbi:hypothetical protein Sjap_014142 [Stephania japonica]|uniref:Uncharacterized protein n=1 Tax=Stephania japonica TaxID=461633 RepID=A0AAP0P0N6_9MAGN
MPTSALSDVSSITSLLCSVPCHHRSSSIFRSVSISPINEDELISNFRSTSKNKRKIRLQLTKPVTWPPLIWGVVCGTDASGNIHWNVEDVAKSIVCMAMSGPCLTGYTQTLNDWYGQEIHAINEHYRPIPSGRFRSLFGLAFLMLVIHAGPDLTFLTSDFFSEEDSDAPGAHAASGGPRAICVFGCLGHDIPILFFLALSGSLVSYVYSAPPLKLKRNVWVGNCAMGVSYICLPWWAGQVSFGNLTTETMELTLIYSNAGLGIAILNDFKSIKGDTELGLQQSIPVAFGIDAAKWISIGAIDITQIAVAAISFLYFKSSAFRLNSAWFADLRYSNVFEYLSTMNRLQAHPFLVLGLLVTAPAMSPQ